MDIQVGKKYKQRDDQIIEVTGKTKSIGNTWLYIGPHLRSWNPGGSYFRDKRVSKFDLVEEVTIDFSVGDFVIIKDTIGNANEVCTIDGVSDYHPYLGTIYTLSNGHHFFANELEHWNQIEHEHDLYRYTINNELKQTESKMKIDINKKYKTRDGRNVEIIAVREEFEPFPVIGAVDGVISFVEWSICGESWSSRQELDGYLVEVPPYEDFNIDDPVLVRQCSDKWTKGYFAGVNEKGLPLTFIKSHTSFITDRTNAWAFCVKYEDRTPDMVINNDG